MDTWEPLTDSDLYRCTQCKAEFRPGYRVTCTCSDTATSAGTPGACTSSSDDDTPAEVAADVPTGNADHWRGEIRKVYKAARRLMNGAGAFSGVQAYKKPRKGAFDIDVVDESVDHQSKLTALGHQIRALDLARKAAVNGYQAAREREQVDELDRKEAILERLESLERRSKAH